MEKVIGLAQQGLSYSQDMKKLKDERKEYDEFVAYRQHLQKNQPLAAAIGDLMQTFEETQRIPRLVIEGGELPKGAQEIPQGFGEREQRFRRLEEAESRRQQQVEVDRRLTHMRDVVAKDPFLHQLSVSSLQRHGRDLALQKLVDAHLADPNADVEILAQHVATDMRQTLETLGVDPSYVRRKEEDQKRFSSESPAGAPAASGSPPPEPPLTGRDLMSGKVGKAAIDFVRRQAAASAS